MGWMIVIPHQLASSCCLFLALLAGEKDSYERCVKYDLWSWDGWRLRSCCHMSFTCWSTGGKLKKGFLMPLSHGVPETSLTGHHPSFPNGWLDAHVVQPFHVCPSLTPPNKHFWQGRSSCIDEEDKNKGIKSCTARLAHCNIQKNSLLQNLIFFSRWQTRNRWKICMSNLYS